MNMDDLLKTYRGVSSGGQNEQDKNEYAAGAASLGLVWQEIFDNYIPISQFDMYKIVVYGIVSASHRQKSPKWKFKKTKEILATGHDATKIELLAYLQRKKA